MHNTTICLAFPLYCNDVLAYIHLSHINCTSYSQQNLHTLILDCMPLLKPLASLRSLCSLLLMACAVCRQGLSNVVYQVQS
jgi:hypothetical protein